ncbi:RusA family crossover junction endodeoxyribonuclease [Levyella massiliensis]|uniref:RusA family crossover junction endodeoxyribonuclease n=1 Tax=Levyella massiliensis TaxID=938289 RepID=UPI0024AE15AF|nr:RusA family crossover junction endodeoxyribonuclease [Levyella massiliensis]
MISEFNNVTHESGLEFFLSMESPPTVTHQMKKVNFKAHSFYEPKEVKEARRNFNEMLFLHRPASPIIGPVRLITKWCYPPGEKESPSYKTTKPDTDNMIKLLKDCMTKAGFWKDDSQVASEVTEKFWARPTGIYVKVEEL